MTAGRSVFLGIIILISGGRKLEHIDLVVIADGDLASVCTVICTTGYNAAIREINHADAPPKRNFFRR